MAEPTRLVLDEVMPEFDVVVRTHVVVDAPPEVTARTARQVDMMTIHTPLLDAAMWVRGLPMRLGGRPPAPVVHLRLIDDDGMGMPGWMLLGEEPGREIAFGAIGVFWTPQIVWNDEVTTGALTPSGFRDFAEPGWGKIGCTFASLPYGAARTLFTYECRVATTDVDSARRFGRYWGLIRPFVRHIMGATARRIAETAVAEAPAEV
jgi:hypothetical protein